MYLEHYGLRELPFELTPNPAFLYFTPGHREALSNLQHGVQARKGLTLLIGQAGTGKTTLLRTLARGLEKAGACFFCVSHPTLTRKEFAELLAHGFGLSPQATASKAALLVEMQQALKARMDAGRLAALVVDEAQGLSDDLLEEVRLLANIETDAVKLLPIVLAGQPSLADRLNTPALWQLKQRVSLRCDLQPLKLRETAAYIVQRIRMAGGNERTMFTREAVLLIYERSAGIPRVVNTLCDNALTSAFGAGHRLVTREIVLEVCRDFDLSAPAEPPHADRHVTEAGAGDPAGLTPKPPAPGLATPMLSNVVVPPPARARRFGLFSSR